MTVPLPHKGLFSGQRWVAFYGRPRILYGKERAVLKHVFQLGACFKTGYSVACIGGGASPWVPFLSGSVFFSRRVPPPWGRHQAEFVLFCKPTESTEQAISKSLLTGHSGTFSVPKRLLRPASVPIGLVENQGPRRPTTRDHSACEEQEPGCQTLTIP